VYPQYRCVSKVMAYHGSADETRRRWSFKDVYATHHMTYTSYLGLRAAYLALQGPRSEEQLRVEPCARSAFMFANKHNNCYFNAWMAALVSAYWVSTEQTRRLSENRGCPCTPANVKRTKEDSLRACVYAVDRKTLTALPGVAALRPSHSADDHRSFALHHHELFNLVADVSHGVHTGQPQSQRTGHRMVGMRNLLAEHYSTGLSGANGSMGDVADLTRDFLYRNIPHGTEQVEHNLAVTNMSDFIGIVPQVCCAHHGVVDVVGG
jgi:hypothetical protein